MKPSSKNEHLPANLAQQIQALKMKVVTMEKQLAAVINRSMTRRSGPVVATAFGLAGLLWAVYCLHLILDFNL